MGDPKYIAGARVPDPVPNPEDLSTEAQEALELMLSLPADEVAGLARTAFEDPNVRGSFVSQFVTVPAGVNIGDRGNAALYLSKYYSAPVACMMAITRQNPETDEWQLLIGERASGARTIIGGHYTPFLPEECWDYFFKQGFEPEELQHYFRNMTPPANHEEDVKSKDVDLVAAVVKETLQEARIFLMPKELSDEEKASLAERVTEAFGDDVSISYDYTILNDNTLWDGVGDSGKGWHSLLVGFGVVLHDQQDLNHPRSGDDIAKTFWVDQSKMTSRAPEEALDSDAPDTFYLGQMIYGEQPIVENALAAIEKEIPLAVKGEHGEVVYEATLQEMKNKINQISFDFNLESEDLIGEDIAPKTGAAAAEFQAKALQFMALHYQHVQEPFERGAVDELSDLFVAEATLLHEFIEQAQPENEDALHQKVADVSYEDFRKAATRQMAGKFGASEQQEQQAARER